MEREIEELTRMSHRDSKSGGDIFDHKNIRNFLHIITVELEKLENNTKMYFKNIEIQQLQKDSKLDEGIDAMKSELDTLTEGVRYLLGPFWQNINNEMSELNNIAHKREVEASNYKIRCQNQDEIIRNLQGKVEKLEATVHEQNSFLSSLGSTLAGLLWKVSKSEETAKTLIESSKFIDLFSAIGDILKSFFVVYDRKMPPTRSDEVQFIISLVGIIVNITALTEGRQFIIETPQGQGIINYLVRYVPQFSDSNIQRLMLMAIFNISIHEQGTRLILNERRLFTLLKKHITGHGVAMKYVSLKLLQAMIHNTKDITHLSTLIEEIPLFTLMETVQISSEEERNLIRKIHQQYLKLQNVCQLPMV